jgi:hypothetical protein
MLPTSAAFLDVSASTSGNRLYENMHRMMLAMRVGETPPYFLVCISMI